MDSWAHALLALVILLLVSVSGWPVTVAVLRLSSKIDKRSKKPSAKSKSGSEELGVSHLRGGLWIGLVERFGTAAAIIFGQAALIAVIVAIKGLGRFKELSTPEASERFVLGTLTSLIWAALGGAVGLALLNALG